MANEQSKFIFKGVVDGGAHAPSQAARTSFTPGKTNVDDKSHGVQAAGLENENWNHDFLAANGVNSKDYYFERTMKVDRRLVNDQVAKVSQINAGSFAPAAVDSIIFMEQRTGGDWMLASNDLQELSVVLTTAEESPSTDATFTVTATFPRAVTGMLATSLAVTNATATYDGGNGGGGTGTVFVYTLTPTLAGDVTAYVKAGEATAADTVTNSASNVITITHA